MPVAKTQTIWPTRVSWPRQEDQLLPALARMSTAPAPYVTGKSRFVISPIRLTLDQLLFLITAALLAIGLVMVQSADARVRAGNDHRFMDAFTNKNVMHAGIAVLVMTLAWRLDYRWLLGRGVKSSLATWLVVATIGLLGLVLATPLGLELNGARRWLALGPLSFQPSELAKLGLVLFVGSYAVHRQEGVRKFFTGFVPVVAVVGLVAVLIVKEDFGTTVLIVAICFVLLVMAGCRWWHLALLFPPAGVAAYFLLWHSDFRRTRLLAFLHPEQYAKTIGYHPLQSLLTIMSGGFWGRGLGNGIQKMGYLPEDNTDFIFAVICEELGFFGALMVVALFVSFVIVGWRIAARCNHLFGKMVAFGITGIIGLQAAINLAVVTVSMPTKGIALPLISSGGTGWIMMAAAVGVLMSIERVNRLEARQAGPVSVAPRPLGFPIMPPVAKVAEPAAMAGGAV